MRHSIAEQNTVELVLIASLLNCSFFVSFYNRKDHYFYIHAYNSIHVHMYTCTNTSG